MNKNLLILGAGQYGSIVKEIALEMGYFDRIAFLDDLHGSENPNYHEESIGKIEKLDECAADYTYVIPAIGNPDKRLALVAKIEESGFRIPIIASPRAYVSQSAQIQRGAVIEPLAGIRANTLIGIASYISMGAVVNHNSVVLEGCHIDNNAVVMSGALVVAKTYVAPCEVVRSQAKNLTLDGDGRVIKKPLGSYPQCDKDAEWVKQYTTEYGHEPSFF